MARIRLSPLIFLDLTPSIGSHRPQDFVDTALAPHTPNRQLRIFRSHTAHSRRSIWCPRIWMPIGRLRGRLCGLHTGYQRSGTRLIGVRSLAGCGARGNGCTDEVEGMDQELRKHSQQARKRGFKASGSQRCTYRPRSGRQEECAELFRGSGARIGWLGENWNTDTHEPCII